MNRPNHLRRVLALCVAGVAVTSPAGAQNRGPYVQRASDTEMTVAWRTASAQAATVCYGSSTDALVSTATGPTATQHEVRIEGLSPATRYYYAIAAGSCPPSTPGSAEDHFVTAPIPGTAAPFRFWVVGDSGTGGSRQAEVRDAMLTWSRARRPDIFLHVGDMAYTDGTTAEFDSNFFAMYAGILRNTVCWPAMGNHEGHSSDSATQSGPYYDAYVLPTDGMSGGLSSGTEAYYSYDHGNVHFVVLDSHDSPRSPGGAMLTWLQMDLAATDQPWIVAYWHHPPYTKGSHDSDAEGQLVDMRENALPILEAAGVDLVLAGHSHIYERSFLIQGAYDTPTTLGGHAVDMGDGRLDGDGPYERVGPGALYIVAGHGGTGLRRAGTHPVMFMTEELHGSVIGDVSGNSMTLRNIRYDGVESDHVTLVKGAGLFLVSPVGGERYLAGTPIEVRWGSVGATSAVRLEYSIDGGGAWATIADMTANDGTELWTAPAVETSRARIRLTDVDDTSNTAESGDFTLAATAEVVAIPFGGTWEYDDSGTDLGTSWLGVTGGWASGPAELGYGDGDEATTLRDEDPNIPTVYFRQGITVTGDVVAARLRARLDDGIAVWVNGTRVFAHNVDDPSFGAWATAQSADNEAVSADLDLAGTNPFVIGDNVVAAVAKQSSATSSDLSFDLELTLEVRGGGVVIVDGGTSPVADGGDAGGPPGGSEDGGCGCGVAGARDDWPTALCWVLALGLTPLRRRILRASSRRGRRRP